MNTLKKLSIDNFLSDIDLNSPIGKNLLLLEKYSRVYGWSNSDKSYISAELHGLYVLRALHKMRSEAFYA